jgi:integrase
MAKAKSDTRYLKRQYQSWYFVAAVPRVVRGRFVSAGRNGKPGKPLGKIVVSLNTQSLSEAQERRWPLVNQWRENFRRAMSGAPLTRAEIEELARETYTATLERLEADAKRHKTSRAVQIEDLWLELGVFGTVPAELDAMIAARMPLDDLTDFDFLADDLAAAQRRKGVTLDPGSETFRLLGQAIARAKVAAFQGRLRMLRGEPTEPLTTFLGADGIDPVTLRPIAAVQRPQIRLRDGKGICFSEAAARYIDEMQRDPSAKLTEHTRRQRETVFRLFKAFAADAPLVAIDKLMASEFLELVAKLDPKWHNIKGAQELPLGKLVEKSASRPGRLSNRTINSYVSALSGVFKWADKRGYFEGRNPFAGQSRAEGAGNGWRAYNSEELTKLFNNPLLRNMAAEQRIRPKKYTFENAMAWIPLIALFSGMRSNEICQMRAGDVRRKEGIWVFNVSEEAAGQSLKTTAAARVVPVHSELVRCGFLNYLKALQRDGQLFPALKSGGPDGKFNHYFAKRFTVYRRGCGVTAPRTSFHSFRKNVAQALKDKRATPAEIAELIGHEQGFTLSVYAPMQLPLPALSELIERVKYPGLRLSHLYTPASD